MRGPGPAPTQRPHLSHHLVEVPVEPGGDGSAEVDLVAARLWTLGAVGIEECSDRLVAAFVGGEQARAAATELGAAAPTEVADDVGLDVSRDAASAIRAGGFVVHPPWVTSPSTGQGLVIDPRRAFGSGSHPSTRLALRALSMVAGTRQRVLDLGCGSGVLAVAAAVRGATVVATDIDPEALRVTAANAGANNVSSRIEVVPVDEVRGPFDIVVVNMTIDHHEAVAADVRSWAAEDATLVVSGVLSGPQVERAADAYGRALTEELVEGEWSCATLC